MKQPIPITVLLRAQENQKLSALWCWCVLKRLYRHTAIYKPNYQKLQTQTGISHTTLRKRVKELTEMGWASWHNGNLTLTGINKLKKHKYETVISLPVHNNKGAQVAEFRGAIVILNLNNQKKVVAKKLEIVNNCDRPHGKVSKRYVKDIRKAGGLEEYRKSILTTTTLSNKSFGALFGLSKYTGQRIQKLLNGRGIIRSKKRFELIADNVTELEFNYVYRVLGYIYNYKTKHVYKQLSNEVVPQAIVV